MSCLSEKEDDIAQVQPLDREWLEEAFDPVPAHEPTPEDLAAAALNRV